MYHRRKRMKYLIISAILLLSCLSYALPKSIQSTPTIDGKLNEDHFDNSIIDFDEDYTIKYDKKYGNIPWNSNEHFNKESHKYTIVKESDKKIENKSNNDRNNTETKLEVTSTVDYSVIPLELLSTTDNTPVSIAEKTTEFDLTVIPLSTTKKTPKIEIKQTVTLPSSTQETDTTTDIYTEFTVSTPTTNDVAITERYTQTTEWTSTTTDYSQTDQTSTEVGFEATEVPKIVNKTEVYVKINITHTNTTDKENISKIDLSTEFEDTDVPIFTELDTDDDGEVPEDYYDSKDIVPTTAPKTDALSVIFGFAGSVVESVVETVAERVVPKGIVDLFRRMQRQNEMLEAERLRSREENGGIGKF